ncbi:hypothetical protein PAESOLCIP111_01121 [Paenibacillus solanacearum]|uniref:Probable membrane transporter protein n=1 Tax=Paenibacillus solanacearum TaxID=2048548 RepID=A0A916JYZ1_9BACL|nr:sulfite exporter TauE/SafE family protein [Paenibacillus solanacearum]CAG7608998.1 hypothetical protein PAESOLCIP111_01121 [Paenibacillus solanacearum]
MFVQVAFCMFAAGLLLGFTGAGGSGFIIAILTVGFGYPIHTALGTALSAMFFSSLSGTLSHYREGNARLRAGLVVGICGAAGAWGCSQLSGLIPADQLKWMTSSILFISGLMLWLRIALAARLQHESDPMKTQGPKYWASASCVGLGTGALSGLFGIGATPFIQIGLMTVLKMSARYAAGTTMLVIVPIALGGGVGYYRLGYLDIHLLLAVTVGIMMGSYLGAKLTRRVPLLYLQAAMALVPMIGATILLL